MYSRNINDYLGLNSVRIFPDISFTSISLEDVLRGQDIGDFSQRAVDILLEEAKRHVHI